LQFVALSNVSWQPGHGTISGKTGHILNNYPIVPHHLCHKQDPKEKKVENSFGFRNARYRREKTAAYQIRMHSLGFLACTTSRYPDQRRIDKINGKTETAAIEDHE
jgi:hypothetical protein